MTAARAAPHESAVRAVPQKKAPASRTAAKGGGATTERYSEMGNIGDNPREVEYEPLTAPSVPEPITTPAEPVRVPEEVPA